MTYKTAVGLAVARIEKDEQTGRVVGPGLKAGTIGM